jgi:ABC transporter substrate binding protein
VGLRAATLALACITGSAAADPPRDVVLLKRAGITAYEEVSEEFGDHCRVRAHVVTFGDEGARGVRQSINRGDLVVTVGQEALDAVVGAGARVIPTLAFHTPRGLIGPPAAPAPDLLLKVLSTARPGIKVVGAVYGARSEEAAQLTAEAARRLGLVLLAKRVGSGPEAVRALHELAEKHAINAIWLPGDTDVITPQVFQYALRLQLERGLPVAAATRQQVHSGALLAVDFSPRAAGRAAADLANRVLDGKPLSDGSEVEIYGGARITVSATAARRLGVDADALLKMGAKLE